MTTQQYIVATLCILFMAGMQVAIESLVPDEESLEELAEDGSAKNEPKDEIEDSTEDFEKQKHLAAAWTQTKVREEVRIAILEKPQRFGRRIRILKSLGWRIDEPVLDILNDPTLKRKLTTPVKARYFGEVTPLSVAIEMMEHSSEKLVDPLLPYATHANADVRGDVAEVLGQHPTPKTLSHIRRALTDGDVNVQHSATLGLSQAKKVDAASQAELYPIIERQANDGKNYSAAAALLALDEKRALAFFESEAFCRVESPGLSEALQALVKQKKNLPREKLLKLIRTQESSALENGLGWQMSATAQLLGRQQHPDDAKLFEALIDQPNTAGHVAEGYLAYHGMDDLSDRLMDAYKKKTWEGLTQQQRYYYAVSELDGEVNNGGLDQYLSNPSGEHAKEALEGLYEVGLTARARRLSKEYDRIGKFGPSKNATVREGQLHILRQKNEDPFSAFDDAYYEDKTSVFAYLAIYAVKNKAAFK